MSNIPFIRTVADFLKIGHLSIICGKRGLSSEVRSVEILDVPSLVDVDLLDAIIVTSVCVFGNDLERLKNLVSEMIDSGAVALAIRLTHRRDVFPPSARKRAEDAGLPVLEIPSTVSLASLLNSFVGGDGRKEDDRSSFELFADIVLHEGGLQQVLYRLAEFMGGDVAFRDVGFKATYLASRSDEFDEQIRTYPIRELLRIFESHFIERDGVKLGYLILNRRKSSKRRLSSGEVLIIDNAVIAIRLCFEQRANQMRIERQYRNEFVRDLLYGRIRHAEEIENRAATFGWKLGGSVIALVVEVASAVSGAENEPAPRVRLFEHEVHGVLSIVESRIRAFFPHSIFSVQGSRIIFLVSPPAVASTKFIMKNMAELCCYVCDEVAEQTSMDVDIGVGGLASEVIDAGNSYREACQAIEVARLFIQDTHISFWDELGSYKLLSTISQSEDARSFVEECLAKLVDYDRSHNASLLETLFALDRNNWNLRATSENLFVHYNTIKYRFRRICDVINFDPADNEQRFNITLSLKIYKMLPQAL